MSTFSTSANRGPTSELPRKQRWSRARRREALLGYLYIAPWAVGYLLLILGPVLASLYLSLTQYSIISQPTFIGLANYIKAFTDDPLFIGSQTHYPQFREVLEQSDLVLAIGTRFQAVATWFWSIPMPPRLIHIDADSTMVVDGTQLKVIGWYDNEWGYSNRVIDLIVYIGKKGL